MNPDAITAFHVMDGIRFVVIFTTIVFLLLMSAVGIWGRWD